VDDGDLVDVGCNSGDPGLDGTRGDLDCGFKCADEADSDDNADNDGDGRNDDDDDEDNDDDDGAPDAEEDADDDDDDDDECKAWLDDTPAIRSA
jgi:hypothetical protein